MHQFDHIEILKLIYQNPHRYIGKKSHTLGKEI